MKKKLPIVLIALMTTVLITGCAVESSTEKYGTESEIDVSGNDLGVDISSVDEETAHNIAHEITENISEYVGTELRIKGHYEFAEISESGSYVHGIVIEDPELCCNPVFEFVLNGEYSFPDDYPELNDEIVIEGILKSKDNNGHSTYYLETDEIETL